MTYTVQELLGAMEVHARNVREQADALRSPGVPARNYTKARIAENLDRIESKMRWVILDAARRSSCDEKAS